MATTRLTVEAVLADLETARAMGYGINGASPYRETSMSGEDRPTVCALGARALVALGPPPADPYLWPYAWLAQYQAAAGLSDAYAEGFGRAFNGMPPNYTTYTPDTWSHPQGCAGMTEDYAVGYFDGLRARVGATERGIPIGPDAAVGVRLAAALDPLAGQLGWAARHPAPAPAR